MSVEGFFHDAHEVYARASDTGEWRWLATLANRILADNYAHHIVTEFEDGWQFEVRQV